MRAVWKYTIPINEMTVSFTNTFMIPAGAILLHVGEQNNNISMWYEVVPDRVKVEHKYQIFGTGHADIRPGLTYRGTGILDEGKLVLHVYEDL